jgi:hypothetical protein
MSTTKSNINKTNVKRAAQKVEFSPLKVLPRALRVIAPESGSGVEKQPEKPAKELLLPVSQVSR